MTIHTISQEASLDSIWEDLVFSEARMTSDLNAADFAATMGELVERCESVRTGQYKAWRAEIVAQANVAAADDNLDDTVDGIDEGLQHAEGRDRSSKRYKRYFALAPHAVIRLGLESQLGKVRGWPESLKTEPEKELRKLGETLLKNVDAGDAALAGRRTAAAQRADHRVREIARLIDDVNAARLSIYGTLVTRGAELKLAKDWANRFFRRTVRAPRKSPAVIPSGTPDNK